MAAVCAHVCESISRRETERKIRTRHQSILNIRKLVGDVQTQQHLQQHNPNRVYVAMASVEQGRFVLDVSRAPRCSAYT